MEEKKAFTFSTDKTNTMIIGEERGKKEMKVEVRKGKIAKAKEYKYLGNWVDETGKPGRQIEYIEKKATGIANGIRQIAKEEELGKMSTAARLLIYERTGVPTMTFNMETWTKIESSEMERLEKVQGKVLKHLLQLPTTTPTWGVLKETGIWTIQMQITYQRLMLYQNLITSDEERLGRRLIEAQEEEEWDEGWMGETKKIARKIGIRLEEAKDMKKSKWKKELKTKIREELERKSAKKEGEMKKLRHQKGQKYERKQYLEEMAIAEASETIKRRLEMQDVGNNWGKKRECKCGEKETTEHMIECGTKSGGKCNAEKEWLTETDNVEKIREVNEWIKKELMKLDREIKK